MDNVDAIIDEACAREKSIRHGHPSTLHLWLARRPLAAARVTVRRVSAVLSSFPPQPDLTVRSVSYNFSDPVAQGDFSR